MAPVTERVAAFGLRIANGFLLPAIEPIVAPRAAIPLRHPVIFIVGAPRSGSTLLMQLVSDAFDIGYMSNGHCRYFGAPALAEKLLSPLRGKRPSDFQSRHGATSRRYEPSECAGWWYRFFPRDPAFVGVDDVEPARMRRMRRSLAALVNSFDRPVLLKNLYASVRLGPIIQLFPEALFVVVSRDELENARSLLRGRLQATGSYSTWWSVPPPAVESLRSLPPHGQVVEQIRGIYAQIDRDFDEFGVSAGRILRVRYESLCEHANRCIDEFGEFLARYSPRTERLFDIPPAFERRTESALDPELDAALARYIGCND